MPSLENRMVLHGFMCKQFGYGNLRAMLECLNNASRMFTDSHESRFAQAIAAGIYTHTRGATKADVADYDDNIVAHSQTLGVSDERGKTWKPFQYLALLFTERYLDLYFQDEEVLLAKLNQWQERWNSRNRAAARVSSYTNDDLRTLAFQSATGSGKTLLLHANILQYQHYLKKHQRLHKLNKIILVTPDEGLSRQHLNELRASNIPACLFSNDGGADALSYRSAVVDIIDLHKLDEKKGIKRVALEAFEDNNLVMVDEGHLGTGGKVWRKRRKQLAKNGFTFEYSATFNQAVAGSGDEIKKLRDEYGKSILFDYSYRFFYADGYGKDYKISNLRQADDAETNNFYLLACLLTFYQQCLIFREKSGQWRDFNLARPLWVFLGKTVTGGAARKEIESDVVRIVNFLAWAQNRRAEVLQGIERLISDNTELIDKNGKDIFKGAFPFIQDQSATAIYDDLRRTVFLGDGQLRVSHLKGEDELQLRMGDASPFGVINVGDAPKLYAKLEANKSPLFSINKDAFSKPLFRDVDSESSPVNVVIGARKFVAGWNSWRVSTMGLMHVGTGEGPQIIQMFGRGVRLKGRGMSLKRHTRLKGIDPPADSEQLQLLETLNIFGLRANYMDKFKEYLQREGIKVDRITIVLPTRKQFANVKSLKIIRKRENAGKFECAKERFDLPGECAEDNVISLDRHRSLQALKSGEDQEGSVVDARESCKLDKRHLKSINKRLVYHKVLERKQRSGWHNMGISQETINRLLEPRNDDWYELLISPEKLQCSRHYSRVHEWENLAVDLITEYADRHWRNQRNRWEHKYIEAKPLGDEDANYVEQYELSVAENEKSLIEDLEKLAEQVRNDNYDEKFKSSQVQISLLAPSFHAYKPLLYAGLHESVRITPLPLNKGEDRFVKSLKSVVEKKDNYEFLCSVEIYLMRNLSRGKGISFFDDYSFYPDFILWLTSRDKQDVLFIDPKGLVHYNDKISRKVDLHEKIKDTESKIREKNPKLFLHSYIWSSTSPKDIGSDRQMSENECHQKGIFISEPDDTTNRTTQDEIELINLLSDALKSKP